MRSGAAGAGIALALLVAAGPSGAADPSVYLLNPTVTQGEHEIDFRFGAGSSGPSTQNERAVAIGFGMGITQHWFSEISGKYQRAGAGPTEFDAIEWENIVSLAEQGEWPVDASVLLETEKPRSADEGIPVRLGALLQREFGRFQVNANVIASRHLHASAFNSLQWRYQFQAKYRYLRRLEFGVQAFGNPSTSTKAWAPFEKQVHRFGPAIMGKFPVGPEQTLVYNVAFLVGATGHSAERTLRAQIEYEF